MTFNFINSKVVKSPTKRSLSETKDEEKDEEISCDSIIKVKIPFNEPKVTSTPLQRLYGTLLSQLNSYQDWHKTIPKEYLLRYSQVNSALKQKKTLNILIIPDKIELTQQISGIHLASSLTQFAKEMEESELKLFTECKETGLALFKSEKIKSILTCNLEKLDPFYT